MSAARILIAEAEAAGARVYLRDGELKLAFRGREPVELIARLRAAKPEIVRELAPPAPVSLAERRAAVEALRDAMSAETARRLDWWREPECGWADSRYWRDAVKADRGMSSNCDVLPFAKGERL
jgi:hypothetical protein